MNTRTINLSVNGISRILANKGLSNIDMVLQVTQVGGEVQAHSQTQSLSK